MVVIDKRRNFIIATAHNFFGITLKNELESNEVFLLNQFLDQAKCRTLYIASLLLKSEKRIKVINKLSLDGNTLVFFKISNSIVTESNFNDIVQVTSMSKNISAVLAEALRQVWSSALQISGIDSLFLKKLEHELLEPKIIASLLEEELLMEDKSREARTPTENRLFEQAILYLKNIRREMESAAAARDCLVFIEESYDTISGHLDDLWKLKVPIYTEQRMQSLLEIIGNEATQLVRSFLSKIESDGRVKDEAVALGASVCEKWVAISIRMTGLFWPHIKDHPWKEKPYTPEKCSNFGKRLREIAEIRAENRQFIRLLTSSERESLGINSLFKKFDNIEELISEENDLIWSRLKYNRDNSLVPIQEYIAAKIKGLITGAKTILAVETEFRRYCDLTKRPTIKHLVRAERQLLLSAYSAIINSIQNGPDTMELLDMPKILQIVENDKVSELRLQGLLKLGQKLLDDLPGFDEISSKLTKTMQDIQKRNQKLIDAWITETQESIMKKELNLSHTSPVVEFTGSNMMQVNFDPRLTTLIREGRGLSGQGVELPREVKDLVERASILMRRARALQQVANFHNTIGNRMIPSQRPLMLTAALELARAIREQSGVVWSDPRAVDVFTDRLRELVKNFGHQNTELISKHGSLRDLVSNLFKGDSINMVTNQKIWKDTLKNMREIVSSVEANYNNTKAWKIHWDRQLLKALGIAYMATLPSLIKKLPEIRVELTISNKSVQWKPTLEDIRTKLYSGIRRFLVIPINFCGVGNQADGNFQTLISQSSYLFGRVYQETEILLNALERFRVKWFSLVAPAKIDISQKLKGKQALEWEKAFKDAKQWAQKVSKLRANDVKILCITIDTGTIRGDLESLSRRYWEQLSLNIRVEASSRLVSIVDFLSSASKKLSHRARTIEEIGETYETYSNIQKQSDEIAQELEDVSGLSQILTAWTREKLEGLSNAHTTWINLKEQIENYHDAMLHQLEEAKLNLRHQMLAIYNDQERWNSKWTARPEVLTSDWIEMMSEKWTNLTEHRDSLINDCKRLNLPINELFIKNDLMMVQIKAELVAEELNCKFQDQFIEELKKQEEEEWLVAKRRLTKFYDWLDSWESRIQLNFKNQHNELIKENSVEHIAHSYIERRITELRDSIKWLQLLSGDELADEHWNELKDLLDLTGLGQASKITLGHLLHRMQLIKANAKNIKDVTKRAAAESVIRQAIAELETWESYTSLPLQESKDSKHDTIYIINDYSTLLTRIGELKLILEGAKGAAGYDKFASRAARCELALHDLGERIKLLNIIQKKWIYLETVYSSGAAPNDLGRWTRADKEFRYFIGEIARDPKIPSLKKFPFHALINLKDLMDRCQRSLDDFLEEKRSSYPRLYFLSDDDLLELVSAKRKGLNAHLLKIYQGVGSIEKENDYITSIISPEGEKFQLPMKINVLEAFPKWLMNLEKSIRNGLQQSLNTCLLEEIPNIQSYPMQILLLRERIRFTEKCEAAIEDGSRGLNNLLRFFVNQRAHFKSLEDPEDELKSLKVKNLLLETVHHLHIIQNLLNIVADTDKLMWNWNRQLRTYKNAGGVIIRCAKAEFPYCFEYHGVAINLVRTSLTEKCYLALTQAMKLGLGGCPTGPAGTGKTESVKALGSLLGRRVLIFNCDEGMDSVSMCRILSGLAQTGAWGCFDEFNRLNESTMSAVSMLIRPLQEAIRDGASTVNLGGSDILVNPYCSLFITMNPAGNSYGGRRKLPDSLARLFRSIGMTNPNKKNIVRTLLECAGFLNASKIAIRLVEIFDTAEKLLSKQAHYDWGLRALKSVINAIPSIVEFNEINENSRMLAGIHISITPKLIEKDLSSFLLLIKDIFPNTSISPEFIIKENKDLQCILKNICHSQDLHENLITRCIQLNDQLKNRSGVAIVGPPGSGKSLIIKTLSEALSTIGKSVKQFYIYPGAIRKSILLGKVDSQTREFKEGLLSHIIANYNNKPLWIIFNGDVEPEWVEALNSALDDNRILTLSNGVRLNLGNETRFIFESDKLSNASPATVSRLGIVYLGKLAPFILLKSAVMKDLSPIATNFIIKNLSFVFEKILKIKKGQKSASGLLHSALPHFENAFTQTSCAHKLLISICGQIENVILQDEMARYIYQLTNIWCPDSGNPHDVLYNADKDVLDPFIENTTKIKTEDGSVYLTKSMQRGINAALPWIKSGQPIIFRGPNGCGKNSLLSLIITLIKTSSDKAITIVKSSALYGTKDLISRLKCACIKLDSSSEGRIYKPKNGLSLILIIVNLHLASKSFQEFIRQLIQEEGFYEDDLVFSKISTIILCTSDSSTELHPRLDSLLASFYLQPLKLKDVDAIVKLHIEESLGDNEIMSNNWSSEMSSLLVKGFNEISKDKSANQWTLTELIMWIDSLKYYPKPKSVSDFTNYLVDASRRFFKAKLLMKQQKNLEDIIISRNSIEVDFETVVYVSKGSKAGLITLPKSHWKTDIENTVIKCVREGTSISTNITSYILEITADISWALGCEKRGLILSGRPGAGRRSSIKIISMLLSLRLIDSGPGKAKESIKSAVQVAGIDGESAILLIEEHHLREDNIPILVCAIISRGELPGLFTTEEVDGLVAPLAELATKEEFSGSLDQYLYYRLRKYLRIALIIDKYNLKEKWLSESNILRHCVHITGQHLNNEWWLISEHLMELANNYKDSSMDVKDEFSGLKEVVQVHLNAPSQQQVPARFFALLYKWKELRETWLTEILDKLKNLQAGIDRLKETGNRVAKLEEDATKQRQELVIEKGRANTTLEKITTTMRGATGQRGEMTTLKMETERESVELARRKLAIEGELGKVEPLVEQAAQAVAGISAEALAEVRSLRAPPAAVRDVLEGVLRLMGIRDTSWNSMKTFLAKRGVKEEIRSWDARRSSPTSLEAVAKLVRDKHESFEDRTAKRASIAAAPLAAWVLANLQYGQIVQQVVPLEREQRVLAARLLAAETQIGQLENGLTTVESKVAQLQEELAAHSRGAAELQLRTEATEASLTTARALLSKLDAEHNDWQIQFQILIDRKLRNSIAAVEAASLLIYEPCSTKKDDKRKHVIDLLISERSRLKWRSQGLPMDMNSLIGAARALHSNLVPIFVDMSEVAVSWLKAHFGDSQMEITRPGDQHFMTSVELAVRFGKPLLVEEIIEFPPILLPLLRRRPLKIGDRTLPIQKNFQLFLTTRQEEILESLPSEADAVMVKIRLGWGTRSFAERLIEKAILQETPEVERRRQNALEREEQLSAEIETVRSELLVQLGASQGQDILQESQDKKGSGLLATLEVTQSKTKEIACALDENRHDLENIAKRSKEHERLAMFTAILHKIIRSFAALSSLYVFTTEMIADIFLEAERSRTELNALSEDETDKMLERSIIKLALHHCLRAVYRRHRLPLALHLAMSLTSVPEEQQNILLAEKCAYITNTDSEIKIPDFIPPEQKFAVQALISMLPEMAKNFKINWMNNVASIYADESINQFERVLIIHAIYPEHLHTALCKWTAQQLGVRSLKPLPWTLNQISEENKIRPVLLLLAPGADPGPELNNLVMNQKVSSKHFVEISLGQDCVAQAEYALELACKQGSWILLSNLQLALNWLPRLERLLRSTTCTINKHFNTRIWLATEECIGFYSELSGLCLKLAYEPPEGVKRNVKKSLQQLQQYQPTTDPCKLLLISWLHAILQERRKFVPQGWIKAYEWSDADLEAACQLIIQQNSDHRLMKCSQDWESDRGILEVAVYGGLLQDEYDMRMLKAIIRHIWSKDMYTGRRKLGNVISLPTIESDNIITIIDRLDDLDSLQAYFGLPANTYRAWEKSAAEFTLKYLREITRKARKVEKQKLDILDSLKVTKAANDIKLIINQQNITIDTNALRKLENNPLKRFFAEEINTTIQLLQLVQSDIDMLNTEDNSKTPEKWISLCQSGSREIIPFVSQLTKRYQSVTSLNGLPDKVQLCWFARPDAFLSALKQYTARETKQPYENLELQTQWTKDFYREGNWRISIIIEGLLLTGARIQNGVLEEVTAHASSVVTAPGCLIAFIDRLKKADEERVENEWTESDTELTSNLNALQVPVYTDSYRNHLICSLPVPYMKVQKDIWHQRGISFHLH